MFSRGGDVRLDALERAVQALHHRGPDGRRTWVDGQHRVGLAHARLSIIDIEGGAQPLVNEDESVRVVVNGELYDFERIRDDLEKQGHTFRTRSDSEILVHLYEQYGTAMMEHLRGEFAFVLYDAKNDLLIAGRDRFGIKPLMYAMVDGVLMFASEAKALFAAGMEARWDEASFATSLLLAGSLEDSTPFAGVSQLAAGHLMVATRSAVRMVRYWDFDFPETTPGHCTPAHIEEVRAALDEATRLRLRADVPVACYLSGGLDSCTVLGLAQRHVTRPIRAFTLGFEGAEYDESEIAVEMAKKAGAELDLIPIGQRAFADDFVETVFHGERTIGNGNSVAKFRLSRAVRDAGVKVVLTGEGSDEVFAGYPHYRRDMFRALARDNPARAQELLDELEKNNTVSRGILMPDGEGVGLDAARRTLGIAPSWMEAFATAGFKLRPLLTQRYADELTDRDVLAPFMATLEVGRRLRGRHVVHQSMYLWAKTMLPNFILSVLGDRMEMAHSVEGRVPFLDHHVVELANKLPIDALIHGSTEKYVVREAAKPFITDRVYRRQKHPFVAPPTASAKSGPLYELMQDTLRGPGLARLPFYSAKAVVGFLDMLPKMEPALLAVMDTPLMLLTSTVILQERFRMGA
jgi:asparagine synthase (glutamine-hydrolysing)